MGRLINKQMSLGVTKAAKRTQWQADVSSQIISLVVNIIFISQARLSHLQLKKNPNNDIMNIYSSVMSQVNASWDLLYKWWLKEPAPFLAGILPSLICGERQRTAKCIWLLTASTRKWSITSSHIQLARIGHMAPLSYKESGKCNLLLCSGRSIRFREQVAHPLHIISGFTAA